MPNPYYAGAQTGRWWAIDRPPDDTLDGVDGDFWLDMTADPADCYRKVAGTWVAFNLGASGAGLTVQDEGTPLATAATTINVVGAGATATGTGATKTLTIPGTPLTTKGDLLGFSTLDARIPVGTNGYVLTADSTAGVGVAWKSIYLGSGGYAHVFGNGADGAADFDGTNTYASFATKSGNVYTLTRSVALSSAIVRNGCSVVMNNFAFMCSGDTNIESTGRVHNDGPAATSFTGATATATSGIYAAPTSTSGANGTQTGAPSNSTAVGSNSLGNAGGTGGSSPSGAGSTGGACTAPTAANGGLVYAATLWAAQYSRTAAITTKYNYGSGGGGGRGESGNPGGGGGAPAGGAGFFSYTVSGTGTVSCNGGNGYSPAAGTNVGGGGGGAGGVLWFATTTASHSLTVQANGGSGGSGRGTGTAGTSGGAGRVFSFLLSP